MADQFTLLVKSNSFSFLGANRGLPGPSGKTDKSFQTLTDEATISYDVATQANAVVTLGGDRLLDSLTNSSEGLSGNLVIIQDGTGGRALSLHADFYVVSGELVDIADLAGGERAVLTWMEDEVGVVNVWINLLQ